MDDESELPKNVLRFEGRWIETGSAEWNDEIMSAINELIDRVLWLERQAGVQYDRINRIYKPVNGIGGNGV